MADPKEPVVAPNGWEAVPATHVLKTKIYISHFTGHQPARVLIFVKGVEYGGIDFDVSPDTEVLIESIEVKTWTYRRTGGNRLTVKV